MYLPDPREEQRYAVHSVPTIMVIEPPTESYDEYHERKKKEEEKKRIPFGFARAAKEN